jgi:hypothetical protein
MDLWLLIGDLRHPEKQKCQNVVIAESFLAVFCLQYAHGREGSQGGRMLPEGVWGSETVCGEKGSAGGPATIDHQKAAGGEAGRAAGEVDGGSLDLFQSAPAAHGDGADQEFPGILRVGDR